MQKLFLLLTLTIMLFALKTTAQVTNEMIGLTQRGFLIKKDYYVRCDIEMNQEQLLRFLLKDPNMDKYARPLAINYTLGNLFGSAASILIALPVVDELRSNNNPNWNLAWIGAGCLAVSIPFKIAFKNNARKAIAYYNSGYREKDGLSFNLQNSSDGIGLLVRF